MNPLEYLRSIARTEGEDPVFLALEAAYALADVAEDRKILLSALRRLLDRHGHLGVIWMLAARISASLFPADEASQIVAELSESVSFASSMGMQGRHLFIDRRGRAKLHEGSASVAGQVHDYSYVLAFMEKERCMPVVVESDLVASSFAVVKTGTADLLKKLRSLANTGTPVIAATDFSLAPAAIRNSLVSRLSACDLGREMHLVPVDPCCNVRFRGNLVAPDHIDSIVSWSAGQEILRPAGPLLG